MEKGGLIRLQTTHAKTPNRLLLLIRLVDENTSLATIYNENGKAELQVWSRALKRRAPNALAKIEHIVGPETMGHGKYIKTVGPELLDALSEAYNEAVQPKPSPP